MTTRSPLRAPAIAAAGLIACAIGACRSDAPTVICPALPTAFLQTIPSFDSIPVADTTRFRLPPSALLQNPPPDIQWSTSSTTIATISAGDGLALGRALGVANISGSDRNTAGLCFLSVWHGVLKVRPLNTLPPDSLPHAAADSMLTFSVSTSAVYANGSLEATFVITNSQSDTITIAGSGDDECLFVVRAYDQSGNVASPVEHTCPPSLVTRAVLPPGATYTRSRAWIASDYRNIARPPAALPEGVYDLEPRVDGAYFKWVGKRVRVQVIRR